MNGTRLVKGDKPDGSPWRVAIEKPTPYTREVQKILDIHQEARPGSGQFRLRRSGGTVKTSTTLA